MFSKDKLLFLDPKWLSKLLISILILCVHLHLGEDDLVDQHIFHLRFYQLLYTESERAGEECLGSIV